MGANLGGQAMWREIFRVAMAVELAFVAIEQMVHPLWLPLAGGHIQQIAILFIVPFVALEGIEAIRAFRKETK
jgi:hypothetical protein